MKVYVVTNSLKLITFNSIKEFELKYSWIESEFIRCVTIRELIERVSPYQDSNRGCLIKLSKPELAANAMLNHLYIRLTN